MNSFAHTYERTTLTLSRHLGKIALAVFLGFLAWGIVVFVQWNIAWHRGIWAGMHQDTAIQVGRRAMIVTRGKSATSKMHFATPPAVREHSTSALSQGQVWNVHLVGPRGVKWCVIAWDPGENQVGKVWVGSKFAIQRGCRF